MLEEFLQEFWGNSSPFAVAAKESNHQVSEHFTRPCRVHAVVQNSRYDVKGLRFPPTRTDDRLVPYSPHNQRLDATCILADGQVVYFAVSLTRHTSFFVAPDHHIRASLSPLGIRNHGNSVVTATNPIVLMNFGTAGQVKIVPVLQLASTDGELADCMMTTVKVLHVRSVRTRRSAPIDQYHVVFGTNEGILGSQVFNGQTFLNFINGSGSDGSSPSSSRPQSKLLRWLLTDQVAINDFDVHLRHPECGIGDLVVVFDSYNIRLFEVAFKTDATGPSVKVTPTFDVSVHAGPPRRFLSELVYVGPTPTAHLATDIANSYTKLSRMTSYFTYCCFNAEGTQFVATADADQLIGVFDVFRRHSSPSASREERGEEEEEEEEEDCNDEINCRTLAVQPRFMIPTLEPVYRIEPIAGGVGYAVASSQSIYFVDPISGGARRISLGLLNIASQKLVGIALSPDSRILVASVSGSAVIGNEMTVLKVFWDGTGRSGVDEGEETEKTAATSSSSASLLRCESDRGNIVLPPTRSDKMVSHDNADEDEDGQQAKRWRIRTGSTLAALCSTWLSQNDPFRAMEAAPHAFRHRCRLGHWMQLATGPTVLPTPPPSASSSSSLSPPHRGEGEGDEVEEEEVRWGMACHRCHAWLQRYQYCDLCKEVRCRGMCLNQSLSKYN